jgi:hypothetical protein
VHVERAVGQFSRSVTLPFEVDHEKGMREVILTPLDEWRASPCP